jgi:hypothetical protein
VLLLVGAVLTWRYRSHIYTDNRRAVAAGAPVARPGALKLLSALTTTSAAIALAITTTQHLTARKASPRIELSLRPEEVVPQPSVIRALPRAMCLCWQHTKAGRSMLHL